MKISDFYTFILESTIGKFPFSISGSLMAVLRNMDDKIASELINLHIKADFVNYSMIDTELDGSDMVSFIPPKVLRSTIYSTYEDDDQLRFRVMNYPLKPSTYSWNNGRNSIRIGRLVRALFGDKFSDVELEKFVNSFKSKNEMSVNKFSTLSGSDIGWAYQTSSYSTLFGDNNPLWHSCMNDVDFLDIYIYNPEVCRLLILSQEELDIETGEIKNKITGRALLWETNEGHFMDRIYYIREQDLYKFIDYSKSNNYMYKEKNKSGINYDIVKDGVIGERKLIVQLKGDNIIKAYYPFPYLDTFQYGKDNDKGCFLANYQLDEEGKEVYYQFCGTEGEYSEYHFIP